MPQTPIQEISLAQLAATARAYLLEGLRYWYLVVLAALVVGGVYAYRASREPATFVANTTFVINERSGSNSGIGSLIGSIGLSGGSGLKNLQKILTFATSQQLINGMLLDSATIDGRPDLLANHIIRVSELDREWDMQAAFGRQRLEHARIDSMDRSERQLLKSLYFYMIGGDKPLVRGDIRLGTDIMSLIARARSEELSLYLSTGLYEDLSNFYTEESTGQAQNSVRIMQTKADSILIEIDQLEYRLATSYDTQLSLTSRRAELRRQNLERQIVALSIAYQEIVKNLETAKYTLSMQTPFFKLLDQPFTPLGRSTAEPLEWGALGALIGAGCMVALLALRLFVLQLFQKND